MLRYIVGDFLVAAKVAFVSQTDVSPRRGNRKSEKLNRLPSIWNRQRRVLNRMLLVQNRICAICLRLPATDFALTHLEMRCFGG
jgi:hypothetical protein